MKMDTSWMPNKMKKRLANKGLGDFVKLAIDTVTFGVMEGSKCGGCQKRKDFLNNIARFSTTGEVPCLDCLEKNSDDRGGN